MNKKYKFKAGDKVKRLTLFDDCNFGRYPFIEFGILNKKYKNGVFTISFYNKKGEYLLNYSSFEHRLEPYKTKPKAHNHPLTSIFTDKMPPKTRKRRLTRKKKCSKVKA